MLDQFCEAGIGENGEAGIRTRERGLTPYNGLANRRLQPLGHLSGRRRTPESYRWPGRHSTEGAGEPIAMNVRALSIRQPFAEAILRGIKTIEYRSQPTRIIGERFFIYASKGPPRKNRIDAAAEGRRIDRKS